MGVNSPAGGLRVAGIVFGIVCLAHLWRLFSHAVVQIGQYDVPMWFSILGAIVAGALSLWMLRLSSRS